MAFFVGGEIVNLILESGPVAKLVLIILLLFSLLSWAVILSKLATIRRARAQSGRFVRMFRKSKRLEDVASVAEQFRPSPLVTVFEYGYDEFRRQTNDGARAVRSIAAVQRAMQIAASEELTRLERRLPL